MSQEKQKRSSQETEPRPTQPAFTPATTKDIWTGLGVGMVCVLGFAIGLWAWFDPSITGSLESAGDRPGEMPGWVLMLIFPLLLPVAFYFWWRVWQDWRNTRAFERSKQTVTGIVTHLWLDKSSGKRYYAGYRFGDNHTAYQSIHSRTYKRMTVGQQVTIEYAPDNPCLSRLNLQKQATPPPSP
jgi:hypothetical protein